VNETLQLDNSRVTWRVVDDEAIAIDLESAQYLSINSSGVGLLERLANGTTYEEMSEHLQAEFGIDRETADSDARAFVASLQELGLIASESLD
jgi:Coenzyme PQQ synthesis protein D (PqqD)